MRWLLPLVCGSGFILFSSSAGFTHAQKAKAKEQAIFEPSPEVMAQIKAKTAKLSAKIGELRKDKKNHELLPDVEIYLRGAENIVRFNEFYNKASGQWTLDALDR